MGQPMFNFISFQTTYNQKTVDFSKIRIVGVEGEHIEH